MDTAEKIAARIASCAETETTLRGAVTKAAAEATREAEAMGWSGGTIYAMWHTFAEVAADMAAAHAEHAEGAEGVA